MRYYPMFISLEGRSCLVVGAGQVGLRKIQSLVDCGAETVVIIELGAASEALLALCARPGVRLLRRPFEDSDLDGLFLAIAATSDAELNRRIAQCCQERGILCNIIDAPEAGSFIVPSCVTRGELSIAISTSGTSPALTKRIRKDLQDRFGEEYARFLQLMSRLRPRVLALGRDTEENSALFRHLVGSRLLEALRLGDKTLAQAELSALLPTELHHIIAELLDDLA